MIFRARYKLSHLLSERYSGGQFLLAKLATRVGTGSNRDFDLGTRKFQAMLYLIIEG